MKQNKKEQKKNIKKEKGVNIKMLAAAAAITGLCGTLFYGISNSVLAAELSKEEKVPTTYAKPQSVNHSKTEESSNQQVYQANYNILDDTLYNENDKVTENELSKEEAAKIGVSFIHNLYDVDLNGTYVYMGYQSGTETFPRAFWVGDICFTDKTRKPKDTRYVFILDAITGELFNASFSKELEVTVSLAYDSALAKDNGEYADVAMQFVKDKGLLKTQPVRVEYSGQGYQINDPDITFYVYGADGEKVLVNFSRYNKSFKGLITQSSLQISEKALESLQRK